MKTRVFRYSVTLIIVAVVVMLIWFFGQSFNVVKKGPHGGDLKPAENCFIEMKKSMYVIHTYLLDSKQATVNTSDVQCEVLLCYADSTFYPVAMSRRGDQGFEGFLPDDYYTACIVRYIIGGKQVSATFDNNKLVVSANSEYK